MTPDVNGWLDRPTLMRVLHAMGFRHYPCSHKVWQSMSVLVVDGSMLCFLVGKRSNDFKYFPGQVEQIQHKPDGSAYVYGGTVVRNYYRDSSMFIHDYILDIARQFAHAGVVEESCLSGVGTSHAAYKMRFFHESRETPEAEPGVDDIYDALSFGDGEAVCLSDGVWLNANGSMEDRGR